MPLTFNSISYEGTAAREIALLNTTGSDTLTKGLLYYQDGIKKKAKLNRLVTTNIVQDYLATPTTPTGSSAQSARELEPKHWMVYDEINPRDWEQHEFGEYLMGELMSRSLPADIQGYIMQSYINASQEFLETMIWQGTEGAGTYKYFDGIITLLDASGDTIDVASPVTLTASNILDKILATWQLIPNAVLKNASKGLMFVVSYKTWKLYQEKLYTLNNQNFFYNQPVTGNSFANIPIVPVAGMPDDCIVAGIFGPGLNSNFRFGADTAGAESLVKFERLQNNSDMWFLKMVVKAAVQVVFPQETVLYLV